MTKEQLIKRLQEIAELSHGDPQEAHVRADDALMEYLGKEVQDAYDGIKKWYA